MQPPLKPEQLEACAGLYKLSRLIHAAVRVGIAPLLTQEPRDVRHIAAALGTDLDTTAAFMDALSAWGLFAKHDGGGYSLTAVGRRLVPDDPSAANLALIAGWSGLPTIVDAFADIEHTLLTGESGLSRRYGVGFHATLASRPRDAAAYDAAMGSTTDAFEAIADALDLRDCELIVDIGGGRGELLEVILARSPLLRGLCVDLPSVVADAPPGCAGRLRYVAGDARTGLPGGADMYITSTVLRCFDDAQCTSLLTSIRRAMTRPSARLVCFEYVLPEHAPDAWLALSDITARVVYGGRDRTRPQFTALLARAGLTLIDAVSVSSALHALTARAALSARSEPMATASSLDALKLPSALV